MRIGIYIEAVKAKSKTGISRYVIGLVEALINEAPDNEYFLYYQKEKLFEPKLKWLSDRKCVKHRAIFSPGNLANNRPRVWWDYFLSFHISRDNLDVFHGPNHFIPKSSTPTVVTIHDLAYYYMTVHGEGLDNYLKNWTNRCIERASKVIAVSNATKEDCINEGCDPKKILCVYQGFEANSTNKLSTTPSSSPYILFIGTIQPRKNVALLINAFARISNQIPHNLVLAGAPGESYEEILGLIAFHSLNDRVLITGFISDEEKRKLYLSASCFVYPSRYEGFGLVVLEAMSYGLPVIASDNSALPEAVGNAGILVKECPEALGEAIYKLLHNPELSNELIKKGFSHIRQFTWETSAKQTLEIYKSLLKKV